MKVKLDKGAFEPIKAHDTDAGYDIRTPIDFVVPPCTRDYFGRRVALGSAIVDTGVHIELPHGTYGALKSKSGLNVKLGITSEGVIDEGYTGSIVAKLYNYTNKSVEFVRGDKITQLIIQPYITEDIEIVDELAETERGNNGFGSSGR